MIVKLNQTADKFVKIRPDIHQHPDFGYEESRTNDLVAKNLAEFGYTVTLDLGGAGVVRKIRKR